MDRPLMGVMGVLMRGGAGVGAVGAGKSKAWVKMGNFRMYIASHSLRT